MNVTLSNLAATTGMVLGTAGFMMSWMNYLRDRPQVRVSLQWDMTNSQTREMMGLVRVVNVGRRPIFISVVALELPKGSKDSHLVLVDSIQGAKLSEGDPPKGFPVKYAGLHQYAKHWRQIRAYVEDSAGKKYRSKRLPDPHVPTWVKQM
jgi:hypothetical protein